jgi:hypothetical protein
MFSNYSISPYFHSELLRVIFFSILVSLPYNTTPHTLRAVLPIQFKLLFARIKNDFSIAIIKYELFWYFANYATGSIWNICAQPFALSCLNDITAQLTDSHSYMLLYVWTLHMDVLQGNSKRCHSWLSANPFPFVCFHSTVCQLNCHETSVLLLTPIFFSLVHVKLSMKILFPKHSANPYTQLIPSLSWCLHSDHIFYHWA